MNSMVEKSPKAVNVLTRDCRSRSSGTEKFVLDADARRALPDVNQPVLVAIDQRLEEDAADDAEMARSRQFRGRA